MVKSKISIPPRIESLADMLLQPRFCQQERLKPVYMIRRHFCSFLFSIAATATFAGCDTGTTSTPQPPASSKIKVLVSPYPLADLVRQIGGDRVEVQWLFEAGQRPEEVEVTPDLRQRATAQPSSSPAAPRIPGPPKSSQRRPREPPHRARPHPRRPPGRHQRLPLARPAGRCAN